MAHPLSIAGFPSQTITEEQFRELEAAQAEARGARAEGAAGGDALAGDLAEGLEQLLAAVAALPWIKASGDKERSALIGGQVLDELEGRGWDIRGPVGRIWRGERALVELVRGKDSGSREAIKVVLYHAMQYDKEHGPKTLG